MSHLRRRFDWLGADQQDSAPDVFETPDEPEQPLKPTDGGLDDDERPSRPLPEGLDGSTLPNPRKAQRVFGRGTRKPGMSAPTVHRSGQAEHGSLSRPDPSDYRLRPRLPPLRQRRCSSGGSSSSESELTSLPRETPAARVRRLKAELAELEAGLATSEPTQAPEAAGPSDHQSSAAATKRKSVLPPRPPVDVVAELRDLRARMEGFEIRGPADTTGLNDDAEEQDEWAQRLRRLTAGPADGQTETLPSNGRESATGPFSSGASVAAPQLSELDKRLAALEDLIGPFGSAEESQSGPLLPTLARQDHLLALLTQPRQIDSISRKVKLLLVDLDRAAAASRRAGTTMSSVSGSNEKHPSTVTLSAADHASLQSLFALLPRMDPLVPILDPLLARLHSLAGLHAEAAEVAEGLRRLQTEDKRSVQEINELQALVQAVQQGLADGAQGIERNWQGLESRMKSLEERIQKLDA